MRGGLVHHATVGLLLALAVALEGRATESSRGGTTLMQSCIAAVSNLASFFYLGGQNRRDIAAAREGTWFHAEWIIFQLREAVGRTYFDDFVATGKLIKDTPLAERLVELAGGRPPNDKATALALVDEALAAPGLEAASREATPARRELMAQALLGLPREGRRARSFQLFGALMELVRDHTQLRLRDPDNFRDTADGTRLFHVPDRRRSGDKFRPGYHAESGTYESRETWRLTDLAGNGRVDLEDGNYLYVILPDGEIRVAPFREGWPHPTLVGGKNPEVIGAGEIHVRDGLVTEVNEQSGHFLPFGTRPAMEKHFEPVISRLKHREFRYRTR